jgi:hypothetical protein
MARTFLFLYCAALLCTYGALVAGNYAYPSVASFWVYTPAHFLGGVSVGFFAALCMALARMPLRIGHVLIAIFVVGVGWEAWEYYLGLASYPVNAADTFTDLAADAAGALAAYAYTRRIVI